MKELIKALRRGAVDKHRCLGCQFEDNCSIHGCRLMKNAAEKLEELGGAILILRSLADDVADYAEDLCSSANDYVDLLNVSELNTGGDGCDKG